MLKHWYCKSSWGQKQHSFLSLKYVPKASSQAWSSSHYLKNPDSSSEIFPSFSSPSSFILSPICIILCPSSCRLQRLPLVPVHCPYFELSADWVKSFEKWQLKLQTGLHWNCLIKSRMQPWLVSNLIVSDLNPGDTFGSSGRWRIYLWNWHKRYLYYFNLGEPILHILSCLLLLPLNMLSWVWFWPDVLQYRVVALHLAKMEG